MAGRSLHLVLSGALALSVSACMLDWDLDRASGEAHVDEVVCHTASSCVCPGTGPCHLTCADVGCVMSCGASSSCVVDCTAGATIDCGSSACEVRGSTCCFDCSAAASCATSACQFCDACGG